MSIKSDFADKVLNTYLKLRDEISFDASEYDVRHRILKYLVEEILGYKGKDYQAEKNRTDIRILDENHSFALVIIETKKPIVDIWDKKWKDQAFGYSDAFTKYVMVTNGLKMRVWDKSKRDKPFIELDFDPILSQKRLIAERLTLVEKSQILSLWNLSRQNLWSEKKYTDFIIPEKIDISISEGFEKLIDKLNFTMYQLEEYALKTFNDYVEGFKKYERELDILNSEQKKIKGNKDFEVRYEREKRDLEDRNKRFINLFRGYEQWLRFSNREDEDASKQVFCRETVYVLLNKIFLIRICEDKRLVTKKISNNGIAVWKQFVAYLDDSYRDLLDVAYKDISQLYSHIYERGIFDWYDTSNGELNRVLNRVLYVFNHFDFAKVDRDILGKIYEKYLPKEERRKLGEFYTPDEIIEHILDQVGYKAESEIEGKDLLDPACGSGGFLVKALNRLIKRYKAKGLDPKIILTNAINHIYGFDINPFACHIAEMNLLFQSIDLYVKAKREDPNFKLPRFNIYQTNSLELPSNQRILWQYSDSRLVHFLEEKERIGRLKMKKFHFVVGNPPYVPVQRLPLDFVQYLKRSYKTPHKRMDLYVPFTERALSMLDENGSLGFIVSDQFLNATYGEKLRKLIAEDSSVRYILDFRDVPVFPELTNYPAIIILTKSEVDDDLKCVVCKKPQVNLIDNIARKINMNSFENDYFVLFTKRQSDLKRKNGRPWVLIPKKKEEVFQKISFFSQSGLGQISKIRYGSISGADSIFIVKRLTDVGGRHWEVQSAESSPFKIEKSILRPYVKGRDVEKWRIAQSGLYIIYPYGLKQGKTTIFSEEELKGEYPCAYKYLLSHKKALENRKDSRGTMKDFGRVWYSWVRLGDPEIYKSTKILSRYLTDRCKFALDPAEMKVSLAYASSVYAIISDEIDLRTLLGLLNSKVTEFCMKNIAPPKAGGFSLWRANYLKRIPIRLPSNSEEETLYGEIRDLVNHILDLSTKLQECQESRRDFASLLGRIETSKLDDYPSAVFALSDSKVTQIRRDKNRIYLNLVDYVNLGSELGARYLTLYLKSIEGKLKKIESPSEEIYNIKIPKKRADLQNVINEYESLKKMMKEIPQKIEDLEEEINNKVYELYGLSEDDTKEIEMA
jgi:type I restriction-modification system DNA methylase subunit